MMNIYQIAISQLVYHRIFIISIAYVVVCMLKIVSALIFLMSI